MTLRLSECVRSVGLGIAGAAMLSAVAFADSDDHARRFDRVFVITMENHGFDEVIGQADATDPSGLLTPYTTQIAQSYGLATYYFGATHPSLPNYLAEVAGDYFGIQSDTASCFAPDHGTTCISGLTAPTILDQLEQKQISWEVLLESMPSVGFLGSRFPATGPTLYAQKHNPFVYFTSIATNPSLLAKIKPFDLAALQTELNDPHTMPRFVYIVPNQCNDQHATTGCTDDKANLKLGDNFLKNTLTAIQSSPSFTDRSVIFVVWDENDFSGNLGCCGVPGVGGGHVAAIVITKNGKPLKSAKPMTHYSMLATIEQGFGLPLLANAKTANTMWDLFPDRDGDDHAGH
jgi:phosphatidylinositol-3-phosphatase